MALHWDISRVDDTDILHNVAQEKGGERPFAEGSPEDIEGDRQWQITNSMIWATIAIGMSEITKANWQTFAKRIAVWHDVDDLKGGFTPADVHRRIGLSTNASTLTEAQFRKRLYESIELRAARKVNAFADTLEKEKVKA